MNFRKSGSLIMVLMLLILAACGDGDAAGEGEDLDNVNESGMPIVKEPISLKFFAGKAPASNDNWNDVLIYNEYEDMTNMDISWDMVPFESMDEKRNLALSSGNLPDAFHSAGMPNQDILKYGEQGVFVPLNDLIEEHAPNFKKILEDIPELKKAITFPDGNIYSFPLVVEPDFISYRMGTQPWVNKEWLETLGMEMPETTEAFYAYLKAAKEQDPGGNDGIPYGGGDIEYLYTYLLGAFGLANKGTNNGNIDLDPDTGTLRFFPITDDYKELLEYMHKLYSEELIAQNIYTIDDEQYRANMSEGVYGSTNFWSPEGSMGKETGKMFTGMPALEGPKGYKEFVNLYPITPNPGAFLITSANEHPVATVRWIDYFYGEEGVKLYFMGVEGKTYEVNADGEPEYMDHILNSKDGLSVSQEQAKYLALPGSNPPSIMKQEYFVGAETTESALKAAEKIEPDLIEDPWPPFIYTKEENDELAGYGADIDKYVTEMRDKFINGNASLDEWDKYVKTIEGMKLDDYMEINQDAYERFKEQ